MWQIGNVTFFQYCDLCRRRWQRSHLIAKHSAGVLPPNRTNTKKTSDNKECRTCNNFAQNAQCTERRKMTETDKQSMRFQLTINNPVEKGYTHEKIREILVNNFKTFCYYCLADEQGSCYHTHIFVCFNSRVRCSTIKRCFPEAHYEIVKGSISDNINYIMKSGKWENDKKHGTQIPDTFEEYGDRPSESKGNNHALTELYEMVLGGMSNAEIIATNQDYILQLNKLDNLRTTILTEMYLDDVRLDLSCTYIYGATGTGKTRGVLDKHKSRNVYRVTDYKHPFDGYRCQDVILFDEFRDSIALKEMLNYCDIYPIELPARNSNKFACYHKIYIVSNWSLEEQYKHEQAYDKESWKAFLRRIHDVEVYNADGSITHYNSTEDYFNRDKFEQLTIDCPFTDE